MLMAGGYGGAQSAAPAALAGGAGMALGHWRAQLALQRNFNNESVSRKKAYQLAAAEISAWRGAAERPKGYKHRREMKAKAMSSENMASWHRRRYGLAAANGGRKLAALSA